MARKSCAVLQKFVAEIVKDWLSSNTVNFIITVVRHSLKHFCSARKVAEYAADNVCRPRVEEKTAQCFSRVNRQKSNAKSLAGATPACSA